MKVALTSDKLHVAGMIMFLDPGSKAGLHLTITKETQEYSCITVDCQIVL